MMTIMTMMPMMTIVYDDDDCIELSVTMFTKLIILMKMTLLLTMRNLTDWWKVEMFEGWKVDGMVEG